MEKKKDIGKHFIFKKDNKLEHYLGENVIFKPNFNIFLVKPKIKNKEYWLFACDSIPEELPSHITVYNDDLKSLINIHITKDEYDSIQDAVNKIENGIDPNFSLSVMSIENLNKAFQ